MPRALNKKNPISGSCIREFLKAHPCRKTFGTHEIFCWIEHKYGHCLSNTAIWHWLLKYKCSVTDYGASYVRNALNK